MRTAEFISLYVGLLIGLGYLVGSIVRSQCLKRDVAPQVIVGAEIVVTMLWAAISFAVIDRLAPGTSAFRNSSAVGFLSSKALTVWESAALWTGLATLLGFVAPITRRAREGSNGLAGAGALLLTYSPIALLAAGAAFVAGSAAGSAAGSGAGSAAGPAARKSTSAGAIGAAVGFAVTEWILGMFDVRTGWGFISGPETALWAVVMAGVLIAASQRVHDPAR